MIVFSPGEVPICKRGLRCEEHVHSVELFIQQDANESLAPSAIPASTLSRSGTGFDMRVIISRHHAAESALANF